MFIHCRNKILAFCPALSARSVENVIEQNLGGVKETADPPLRSPDFLLKLVATTKFLRLS
jgi:hypothetical protein